MEIYIYIYISIYIYFIYSRLAKQRWKLVKHSVHKKNDFVEISKNSAKYKSKNNKS